MMIEYGIQIASLCIMLTIVFNYFRHKRLPLRSTKFFTCFLLCVVFNIVMEFLTLYTITHLDTTPAILNRIVHQLFIGSIDVIIMMLFLYVDLRSRKDQSYNKLQLTIRIIPMVITFFLVLFGDLKYYVGEDGYYSYGFMANTLYVLVVIYLVFTLILLFVHRKNFSKQEITTILLGIASWVIITLIQFFHPTWLLSSLAIVIMTQFLYMSFENSDKFLASKDGCVFTKKAFELTTKEYFEKKKSFFILQLTLGNYESLALQYTSARADRIFDAYSKDLSTQVKGTFFFLKENVLGILFDKRGEYEKFLNLKTDMVEVNYQTEDYKLLLVKKGVECHENYKTVEDVLKVLETTVETLSLLRDGKTYHVKVKDIYYIEAVENKTFIYTMNQFFEAKEKLYQLEGLLMDHDFIRCSKSMICNVKKVVALEKEKNSRMIATLSNEETIVITRQYVKSVKAKMVN